jgi:hypothetical protein
MIVITKTPRESGNFCQKHLGALVANLIFPAPANNRLAAVAKPV